MFFLRELWVNLPAGAKEASMVGLNRSEKADVLTTLYSLISLYACSQGSVRSEQLSSSHQLFETNDSGWGLCTVGSWCPSGSKAQLDPQDWTGQPYLEEIAENMDPKLGRSTQRRDLAHWGPSEPSSRAGNRQRAPSPGRPTPAQAPSLMAAETPSCSLRLRFPPHWLPPEHKSTSLRP